MKKPPRLRYKARSYSYLCRLAGVSEPTGLAKFDSLRTRTLRRRDGEMEQLRVCMEKLVTDGTVKRTPDGKYYLP